MNKTEMHQYGTGSVQVGENHGVMHFNPDSSEDIKRLEVKIDQMQDAIAVLINLIINPNDKVMSKYVKENFAQYERLTLKSYSGEYMTHVLIPVNELFKKPISPSIKKLINSRKVGLSYKGVELQRDTRSISNVISQMRDIDS